MSCPIESSSAFQYTDGSGKGRPHFPTTGSSMGRTTVNVQELEEFIQKSRHNRFRNATIEANNSRKENEKDVSDGDMWTQLSKEFELAETKQDVNKERRLVESSCCENSDSRTSTLSPSDLRKRLDPVNRECRPVNRPLRVWDSIPSAPILPYNQLSCQFGQRTSGSFFGNPSAGSYTSTSSCRNSTMDEIFSKSCHFLPSLPQSSSSNKKFPCSQVSDGLRERFKSALLPTTASHHTSHHHHPKPSAITSTSSAIYRPQGISTEPLRGGRSPSNRHSPRAALSKRIYHSDAYLSFVTPTVRLQQQTCYLRQTA